MLNQIRPTFGRIVSPAVAAVVPAVLALVSATSLAQDGAAERYPVLSVDVRYDQPNTRLPAVRTLLDRQVKLGLAEDGLADWRQGLPVIRAKLADLNDLTALPDRIFYRSGIEAIGDALEAELTTRGYPNTFVDVAPGQFTAEGQDLREGEQQGHLKLVIHTMGEAKAREGGPRYAIEQVRLRYADARPWMPDLGYIAHAGVRLGQAEGGLVAYEKGSGLSPVAAKLRDFEKLPDRVFYPSAIDAMVEAVARQYRQMGYLGVEVSLGEGQIADDGRDLREQGDYDLEIVIDADDAVAAVSKVTRDDGGWYPVSAIDLTYKPERGSLPSTEKIMAARVKLGRTEAGYTAWRAGLPPVEVSLAELQQQDEVMLYGSAIKAMARGIVEQMNEAGFLGVVVVPADQQFSDAGEDLRPEGDNSLALIVRPGVVSEVRSVAAGDRVEGDDQAKLDHPAHERIAAGSPLQPRPGETDGATAAGDGDGDGAGTAGGAEDADILRRDALDRYVHWLNRHPGRRVDVAVAAGPEPETFALDYMVYENKPWMVYFQMSNTGTENTDDWRQRIGFVHNQLTGRDDILKIDYITAGFDDSHTVVGSYEAPFAGTERLRWKVEGMYSEFLASDVGIFGEDFSGESWLAGGELIWNFHQDRDLFIDLLGGVRYHSIHVDNESFMTDEREQFVRPYIGLQAQRLRPTNSFYAGVSLETNLADVAGTHETMFLGRGDADDEWVLLRFDLSYSFYLVPLLSGGDVWTSAAPPVDSLTHELALMVRGQSPLDDARLIPQMQMVAGGLYTIRGYDEAVAVGDNVVVLTAEYRYHLPRALGVSDQTTNILGIPVHVRPPNRTTRPNWDLVLRTFVDYGYVSNNDPLVSESDESLLGAGVGVELQVDRNISLRLDWAAALQDVADNDSGDSRVHFVGTLLY